MPGRKCRQAGTAACGPALLGPGDSEFSHFLLQGRTLHPQAGRGPLRAGHHPAGLAEGAEDVLPLGLGQRHRRGGRLWGLRDSGLQVAEEDLQRRTGERMTERSITFCSSRTFPGQE